MLVKMEIENFKSFKNRTVFDFMSTNYKILQNRNVTDNGILKGAIFVGGNAAGKTNTIMAMKVLLDLLFKERLMSLAQYRCLFSQDDVIKLFYEFNIDNNLIRYQIEYDVPKRMLIEKLLLNENNILERMGGNGRSEITEISTFSDLDNDTLLLRTIYFNTKFYGNEILQKWFKFLSNSIFLDAAIRNMFSPNSELNITKHLDKYGTNLINEFFQNHEFMYQIEYGDTSIGNMVAIDTEGEKSIFMKRKDIGEPIPIVMESLGNKNLLNMLPAFFQAMNEDAMLIIDEFSSAFHNELEELLVKLFMKKSRNSQMFLVSHSTNLLSNTIFRPDQEYSVVFNGKEGSQVNRFSNEKPREAQNIEKMYNSGCFGGKPEYSNE